MAQRIMNIKGMHCNSCAMSINLELEDLPGVESVDASFENGTVVVSYDPDRVSEEQMDQAIDSLGFEVVS